MKKKLNLYSLVWVYANLRKRSSESGSWSGRSVFLGELIVCGYHTFLAL
jgi:hypothetical protein